ncbi:Hypothetical predicted protein [Pelobates cultripes]|uniref:Uncharacterized protein n=1 Tax=Pelobates cultripes TaxID=61616 RepID=A0AAD1RIH3_PELCU|nr:Hypothetical predicted protein [Pelobates cultripes]
MFSTDMSSPAYPDMDKEKLAAATPRKATVKSKHLVCSECATPLPDGSRKKMCSQCTANSLERDKQKDMQSFLTWFHENLAQTLETIKESKKVESPIQQKIKKRRRSPSTSESSSGEYISSIDSGSSSSEPVGFPSDEIRKFIKGS